MARPKTRYAKNGDVSIAYQTVGEGPMDLVVVPGFISHLEVIWSFPEASAFIRRLATFSRVILFDKRGTGLSDPITGVPTLETRMEDVHAVLDAVGSERAALFGISEGGPMSILFAATYPQRTTAMVLYGAAANFVGGEGSSPEQRELAKSLKAIEDDARARETWGEGDTLDLYAPSVADERGIRDAWGLFERASASPAMAIGLLAALREIDVSDVLDVIGAPTLVMHRRDDQLIPIVHGKELAERIPGARFVELPGEDHFVFVGDTDRLLDEVEQFLTGARQSHEPNRVLATVLFTDIVKSTEKASEMGDRRWRGLLEAHDKGLRDQVETYGGVVIKSLGDGYLATFDGPARAIRCGRSLIDDAGSLGIELRAGVHTGECELLGDDVGGMAVHIGARVAARAAPNEVLVSSAVRDLVVGSRIEFEDRGTHELKGIPGSWTLLAAGGGVGPETASRPGEHNELAPNLHSPRRGDRMSLRIARNAPSVARFVSRARRRRVS